MAELRVQRTILEALAHRLATEPDAPYLDLAGEEFTAGEMDEVSTRLAHALAGLGVGKGDRVATLLENGSEQVISFFAAIKLGAIQVPINTAYKGEFLRHQLVDSGATVVVVQGDLAARVADVAGPDTPELAHVVVCAAGGAAPAFGVPVHAWDELLAGAPTTPVPDPGVRPSDLACFIYTAGTTGPSKGCMLPHNYVVALADQITRAWGRRPDDVVLTPLPLFHFNAISVAVVGTLLSGGRAVIGRRFSVSGFWPEVKRTGATLVSMLGSLAILLADADDHPDAVGNTLRLCGAVPMPPDIDRIWNERFGCQTFSAAFGLTEASLISSLPAGEANKPGAAGRPNTVDFDVRLVDDDDNPVPVGEIGEIACRPTGPNQMFAGYFRRPEETLTVLRNLWFHTGDLARLDEDGFLSFVDRKKDYLRRRGENISSFEMERTYHSHPAIVDVAVHSVPSEVGEDDVKVTAVLQTGDALTPEELCRVERRQGAVLRGAALHRVPRRPSAQPGGPRAEVPAAGRGGHPGDVGPRSGRLHVRAEVAEPHRSATAQPRSSGSPRHSLWMVVAVTAIPAAMLCRSISPADGPRRAGPGSSRVPSGRVKATLFDSSRPLVQPPSCTSRWWKRHSVWRLWRSVRPRGVPSIDSTSATRVPSHVRRRVVRARWPGRSRARTGQGRHGPTRRRRRAPRLRGDCRTGRFRGTALVAGEEAEQERAVLRIESAVDDEHAVVVPVPGEVPPVVALVGRADLVLFALGPPVAAHQSLELRGRGRAGEPQEVRVGRRIGYAGDRPLPGGTRAHRARTPP